MLAKANQSILRRKVRAFLVAIVLLPLVLILLYVGSVIRKAYVDTPKVVALATSSERVSLSLNEVSTEFQQILLAVEDPNFYSHRGIDVTTPGAGWTTITQAIVKAYFYNGFTPGIFRYRKLEQSLIALVFNRQVEKQKQLLIFINSAYFGNYNGSEVIGFKAATRVYFKKEWSEITRDEFISLVAMLVGPNEFNVLVQPGKNRDRVGRIKRLLEGQCKPIGLADVFYERC